MTGALERPMLTSGIDSTRMKAEFLYIQNSLHEEWSRFLALEQQIRGFKPKPREERLAELAPEIGRVERTVEGEASVLKGQLAGYEERVSEAGQLREIFAPRFMQHHVVVVILTHALCEGLINAVLAVGLARAAVFDIFSVLEKADFLDKWCRAPKVIAADYHYPNGSAIDESLRRLNSQRNRIVHYKVQLDINDRRIHKGTALEITTFEAELQWLRRFYSLPFDLQDLALRSVPSMGVLLQRGPIEKVATHKI